MQHRDQRRSSGSAPLLHRRVFFTEPMVAEIVTMIAGKDDDCIIELAARLQKCHEPADMIVELGDQPNVGRYNGLAALVTTGSLRFLLIAAIGIHYRMSVLRFLLVTDCRADQLEARTSAIVATGRHIGPMRLNVGDARHRTMFSVRQVPGSGPYAASVSSRRSPECSRADAFCRSARAFRTCQRSRTFRSALRPSSLTRMPCGDLYRRSLALRPDSGL